MFMGYDWIFDGIERGSFWRSDQENTQNGGLRSRTMIWDILLRDNPWMWTNNRVSSGLTKHQDAPSVLLSPVGNHQISNDRGTSSPFHRYLQLLPELPPLHPLAAEWPPELRGALRRLYSEVAHRGRWRTGRAVESVFEGKNWSPKWRLSWLIFREPWLTNDMVN